MLILAIISSAIAIALAAPSAPKPCVNREALMDAMNSTGSNLRIASDGTIMVDFEGAAYINVEYVKYSIYRGMFLAKPLAPYCEHPYLTYDPSDNCTDIEALREAAAKVDPAYLETPGYDFVIEYDNTMTILWFKNTAYWFEDDGKTLIVKPTARPCDPWEVHDPNHLVDVVYNDESHFYAEFSPLESGATHFVLWNSLLMAALTFAGMI